MTAIGTSALVARATGWATVAMVVLLLCSAGLALLDPHRTRPITRPTLRIAGAIALSLLAISATVALVDAVATIV
jgi:hypothetical protein